MDEAFENAYDASLLYYQAACQFIKKNRVTALDTLREGLLEDYHLHHLLFDICPELKEDADIKGILRYYSPEFQ